jgi:hypothetical protein
MRLLTLILSIFCISTFASEEIKGTKEDFDKWKYRAEIGDSEAQYNLASYYGSNIVVPVDYTEAVKWYRKAAEQGHANASFSLAVSYADGIGQEKNETEAAKWYWKSLMCGNVFAAFQLGELFEKGKGVPKNYVEAYALYNICASSNSENGRLLSVSKRDELEHNMTKDQIADGQKRSLEIKKEIEGNINGFSDYYLKPVFQFFYSVVENIKEYWIAWGAIILIGFLFMVDSFNPTKLKIKPTKPVEKNTQDQALETKLSYFTCWWKTAVVLLILRGLLGYLNSGIPGMAMMLGSGIILAPLNALWIAWIWWSIKK